LERRRLTGYRSSPELAWVVFPPKSAGGESVQVLHDAKRRRFRVVSTQTSDFFTAGTRPLGDYEDSDEAAACIEDALKALGHPGPNGVARNGVAGNGAHVATNTNGKAR
jgi:hypothetical protein